MSFVFVTLQASRSRWLSETCSLLDIHQRSGYVIFLMLYRLFLKMKLHWSLIITIYCVILSVNLSAWLSILEVNAMIWNLSISQTIF
ncbi:hypothetical protein A9G49_09375 [Aeromonas sp. ANP5]|nr:hypothetical protein A9G04_09640 [Aeromonas sp. ANNP30]OEC65336.1 hypothetical protein A9G49_09375 [Aeromonas sp. ANP5]